MASRQRQRQKRLTVSQATFATASSTVNLWENRESKLVLLKSFAPHQGAINCIRWNHNNQVLATCGDDGTIVLSRHNGQHLGTIPRTPPAFEPACLNCMSFSNTSRYLCVGSAEGVVTVWDLKETTAVNTMHSRARSAVTCVLFYGADNTAIVSGDESGAILHHSTTSGRLLGSLLRQGEAATVGVVLMRFSPFRKNLLASTYMDGSVALWDLNSRTLKFEFHRVHRGVATAVFFSPLNTALFGSGGSDGIVRLYDANSGKSIHQIRIGAAVTAADFLTDGQTLVTGTADGRLRVDDLKNQTESWVSTAAGKSINWIAPQSTMATMPRGRKTNTSTRKAEATPKALTPTAQRVAPSKQQRPLHVSTSKASESAGKAPALVNSRAGLATSPIHTPTTTKNTVTTKTPSGSSHLQLPAAASGSGPVAMVAAAPTPQPVPHKSFQDFQDMMENIQEVIREDVRDLHLEMLRQFSHQQTQMEQSLASFAAQLQGLVEENARLREENSRLQHIH